MPPISAASSCGAFPVAGPLTYMRLAPEDVRRALSEGEFSPNTRWFHATTEQAARAAAVEGLVPSCWCGGDSCCVFGCSSRDQVPLRRERDWIVEVESCGLPGQLKAWWVPPHAIRGAWHDGRFQTRTELATQPLICAAVAETCSCELEDITREQIARWRALAAR